MSKKITKLNLKPKEDKCLKRFLLSNFKNKTQMKKHRYVCIGPSRDSPVAGPSFSTGKTVSMEMCSKQKCTCGYYEMLVKVLEIISTKEDER